MQISFSYSWALIFTWFEIIQLSAFSDDCNSKFVAALNNANTLPVLLTGHGFHNLWYMDYCKCM